MKVYVDLVFLLNVWLDFLLLLCVGLVLKNETSFKRILLSSFLGGFSTFLLFLPMPRILLVVCKFFFCVMMILVAFSYRSFRFVLENVIYFYLISVILAGFLYLIKNYIDPSNFVNNFLLLVVVTPFILFFYYRKTKKRNDYYHHLYPVELYYQGKMYSFMGFVDTGNRLYDPYRHRPIILVHTEKIEFDYAKGILVPYETSSGKSVLKCLVADKIVIDSKVERRKVLFGLAQEEFKIGDVDMILHSDLIGGIL